MKQFKLAASLFIVTSLFSAAASANIYKSGVMPMSAASTPYNWTGFYVGVNAGAVKHSMDITDLNGTSFLSTIHQVSNPQITGGFQLGYRRQIDLSTITGVYGAEFSTNFANARASQQYGGVSTTYQLHSSSQLENVSLLQLIGGIAADRTLLFLSAGMSWVNISGTITNEISFPFFSSINTSKKALGSTIGGGIEYAFNEKFSARFKVDVVTPNVYSTSDSIGDSFQISNNIVQATLGINYKIG